MTYQTLVFERDAADAFATVTLNRPDKLNSLNGQLLDELEHAVRAASADDSIAALVLTGAGRAFSTGFDLNSEDFELDAEAWREDIRANCNRLLTIW
ncbi:MAG: enoyl-CoA hydratase/isomerase family protein, partial [Comamonadaceae bacterium]|nr:enoyl-CoA hydratase/isomerase family protein [Comamonadaceae bacterium]